MVLLNYLLLIKKEKLIYIIHKTIKYIFYKLEIQELIIKYHGYQHKLIKLVFLLLHQMENILLLVHNWIMFAGFINPIGKAVFLIIYLSLLYLV